MTNSDAPLTFQPIDVDNIYEATYSPWFFLSPTKMDGEFRSEIEVIDLEDNERYIVNAENLAKATLDVLNGMHVGSYLVDQCRADVYAWSDDFKYGVPFDSELSDAIIQIACFGEVVYG